MVQFYYVLRLVLPTREFNFYCYYPGIDYFVPIYRDLKWCYLIVMLRRSDANGTPHKDSKRPSRSCPSINSG
jgi:hypothetical protein